MRSFSKKTTKNDAASRRPGRAQWLLEGHAWVNGVTLPEAKACVSVFDSAYLYGIGLFETLRASDGRIRFWDLHDRRLRKNAKTTGLRVPLSPASLRKATQALLTKNGLQDAQGATIRMMLSENKEGRPSLVITARPYAPYPGRCYREGARAVFSRVMSADSKTLSAVKTTSYLSKMLPRREALLRGADEALLINERGHVSEGASSSLFVVKGGVLTTPPLSDGLLPGTRRKIVIGLAKKLHIPFREKILLPKDLYAADEIFLTSSLKDIMPVGWVEGRKIRKSAGSAKGGGPGLITQRLQREYSQTLRRM